MRLERGVNVPAVDGLLRIEQMFDTVPIPDALSG
jgi:hypothetical protein